MKKRGEETDLFKFASMPKLLANPLPPFHALLLRQSFPGDSPSIRPTVEGRRPSLHQTPPSKNLPIQEEEEEVASKEEEEEGAIRKQGFMKLFSLLNKIGITDASFVFVWPCAL